MDRRPDTALVIVGHGSTTNPDSGKPTRLLVETLRARGVFDEVLCCFWKEEPPIREILREISSSRLYVVPNFISEGYFTRTVIPRELGLDGRITRRGGRIIRYCDPVGSHPSMTAVLLKRAREIAPELSPAETSLLIVGHGTKLNENSAKAVQKQVNLIAAQGLYAEVHPAFMEEPPFLGDWASMTTQQQVIILPYFISDGLHSTQDIPVLLGIAHERGSSENPSVIFKNNPHLLLGKKLGVIFRV